MSIQTGVVKLKGTMGGISFYESDGKQLARQAKGPSRKKILTHPSFERVRENLVEFGGSAKAASSFRRSFNPLLDAADRRMTGRLIGIFKAINLTCKGVRGKRPISLSEHRAELVGFEFHNDRELSSVFKGDIMSTSSDDRLKGSVSINNVLLRRAAKAPPDSTHVMFTQMLGIVSDYGYHEQWQRYAPLQDELDTMNVVTDSDYLSLKNESPVTITLQSTLPDVAALPDNVSVVQCFCVTYFQQQRVGYSPTAKSTVKVVRVF